MTVPAVSASAVRGRNGLVYIALTNVDPRKPVTVRVRINAGAAGSVSGTVLTGPAIDPINSFDQPDTVRPARYTGARMVGGLLVATLPARLVTTPDLR